MTQAEPSTGQGSGKLLGPLEVRELAERLDLTRERVRQIQLEALGQLRRALRRRGIPRDALL